MKQLLILTKKINHHIAKIAVLAKAYGSIVTKFFELHDKTQEETLAFISSNQWDIVFYDADYFLNEETIYGKDLPKYLRENIQGSQPYIVSFSHSVRAGFSNPSADNFLSFPLNPSILGSVIRRALDNALVIMIVEDSSTQRLILKKFIEQRGHQVVEAEHGQEAIEIISQKCPDIIISDIEMPVMDGYLLTEHLSQHDIYSRIPILIVSSLSNSTAIKKALQMGAIDYVTKPYDIEKIDQKVIHYTRRFSKDRKSILVVDDSAFIVKMIALTLESERYRVISAKNGKEGLEKAKLMQPDIITTDYNMPEMDGWEFCRKLKENPKTRDIPVIMITSKSTDLDRKIGRALKVYDYIAKPFNATTLTSTINTALIEQLAEKVKFEKNLLSQEMKVGHQVQNQILPSIEINNDQISAKSGWIPCKELSGDFYDLIDCPDQNHLAIIGDVSGKGLPASLVTVASQACLRGQTVHNQTTGTLLDGLNKYLCVSTKAEMFLTCFIAHIDHKQKVLKYSSAGHNQMILYKKSNNEILDLSASGLPCGMFDTCQYETKEISYESHDI
ncbi:response regulator, partial [bacterium]|nr:response regulator [bacterium]